MKKNKPQHKRVAQRTLKPSKEYSVDELIILGKKNNNIPLAKPLFSADRKSH